MKKLLNTTFGYKLIVIVPSQLLQLIESCIIISSLGFIYPGWVYKYVLWLNNIKNKEVVEIKPVNETAFYREDPALAMYNYFQNALLQRQRMINRHNIRNYYPNLNYIGQPLQSDTMEIMDFGTNENSGVSNIYNASGIYNGSGTTETIDLPDSINTIKQMTKKEIDEVYGSGYKWHMANE